MQPNEQAPPPDYDFILNHGGNKSKAPLLGGFGNSKKHRILLVALGGAILFILIVLVYSLLFGGNKNQALLEVAQQQQEIIRITTLGVDKTSSSPAKSLALTTELTVITNQKDLLAQMRKMGQKTNVKQLALKKNAQTDQDLAQAAADNRYDEAFTKVVQQQLVEYQRLLKAAYGGTSSQALQGILNSQFSQAGILVASTQSS